MLRARRAGHPAGAALSARARRALIAGVGVVVTGAMPGFLTASLTPRIDDDFVFGRGHGPVR